MNNITNVLSLIRSIVHGLFRNIFIIAWRDIKSIMTSPTFLMIGFFCTLVWALSYYNILHKFDQIISQPPQLVASAGYRNIHLQVFGNYLSSPVHLILLLSIPATTMRLLAEEKRQGTYDLLLTSPISATQIALGKYLAGLTLAMTLLMLALTYPLLTSFFVDFPMGPLWTSFLGFSLLVASYVAVGLFASSLTSSMMLSVAFGILFNITLLIISAGAEVIDTPFLASFFNHISIGQQLQGFLLGNLKTHSVVFFLSFISLFVFLTQRIIESSRWRRSQ